MVHDTSDPLLVQLAQLALHEQALYEGKIDGQWGPVTEQSFQVYGNYNRYAEISTLTLTLSADQQADLAKFLKQWKALAGPGNNASPRDRYNAVAQKANVPAELVAAIHWRESGGDFTTYLHNGDPLGKPTTDDPKGILFSDWTPAAIDALTREKAAYAASGIEEWTSSLPCQCIFAEYYNGEGYRFRGVPDPYVLAGTSGYKAGKYGSDGVYDPSEVDAQLGVLVMLRALQPEPAQPAAA